MEDFKMKKFLGDFKAFALKGNIIDYQLIQKLNLTIEILFINSLIIYFKRFYNGK